MFGKLTALFKKDEVKLDPGFEARIETAVAAVRAMARPCLQLARKEGGASWLGGAPCLPEGRPWPRRGQVPMSLLAQLDLAEIRRAGGPEWLPPNGALLFFFDPDYGAEWTGHPKSAEALCVIHLPADVAAHPIPFPPDLPTSRRYRSYPVGYEAAVSLPAWDRYEHLTRGLSARETKAFDARLDDKEMADPQHQIGGYPNPIQDDSMEGSWEPTGGELAAPPEEVTREVGGTIADDDWLLLLQLDSDEEMGTNWVDGGRLYFWVRSKEAMVGDFTNTWVTIQFF